MHSQEQAEFGSRICPWLQLTWLFMQNTIVFPSNNAQLSCNQGPNTPDYNLITVLYSSCFSCFCFFIIFLIATNCLFYLNLITNQKTFTVARTHIITHISTNNMLFIHAEQLLNSCMTLSGIQIPNWYANHVHVIHTACFYHHFAALLLSLLTLHI